MASFGFFGKQNNYVQSEGGDPVLLEEISLASNNIAELEDRILGRTEETEEEEAEEPEVIDLSYLDGLEGMFGDPIEEAKNTIAAENDDCSFASDYWLDSLDGRAVIDSLIQYAEGCHV